MRELPRSKIVKEAAIGGLIGGAAFAAGQTLAAAATGRTPGAPWQMFASIAIGEAGLEGRLNVGQFIVGAVVHFGLATLFGVLFGLIVARIHRPVRNNLTVELTGGAAYGLVLWLINMQVIGRLLYPWWLDLSPAVQALLHAAFYGVPMATWLALRIRDVETPGVHRARHRFQTSTGDEEYLRLRQWERNNEAHDHALRGTRVPPEAGREQEERRHEGPTLH